MAKYFMLPAGRCHKQFDQGRARALTVSTEKHNVEGALMAKTRQNFLLVVTAAQRWDGGVVSGFDVAQRRLRDREWPLYKNTRNRSVVTSGDRLMFYVAGTGVNRMCVVATATVVKIEKILTPSSYHERKELCVPFADLLIRLDQVVILPSPVSFRARLSGLDCRPTNMGKWGAILQGGCRRLTDRDFTILSGEDT